MSEVKQKIETIIHEIQNISDLLYQQKSHEAFLKLASLLAGMSELSTDLFTLKQNNAIQDFDDKMYLETLVQAMNALEAKDEILLADVLNYDFMDQLKAIAGQL